VSGCEAWGGLVFFLNAEGEADRAADLLASERLRRRLGGRFGGRFERGRRVGRLGGNLRPAGVDEIGRKGIHFRWWLPTFPGQAGRGLVLIEVELDGALRAALINVRRAGDRAVVGGVSVGECGRGAVLVAVIPGGDGAFARIAVVAASPVGLRREGGGAAAAAVQDVGVAVAEAGAEIPEVVAAFDIIATAAAPGTSCQVLIATAAQLLIDAVVHLMAARQEQQSKRTGPCAQSPHYSPPDCFSPSVESASLQDSAVGTTPCL